MICPNCGYNAKDTDRFCVRCATRLIPEVEPAAEAIAEEVTDAAENAEEKIDAVVDNAVNEINVAAEKVEDAAAEAVEKVENKIEEAAIAEPAAPVVPVIPVEPNKPAEPIKAAEEVKPAECCRLTKPLTTWGYLWRILLFALPIIGIIPLFVMAFASGINKNSRGLARAILIVLLVLFILAAAATIFALVVYGSDTVASYFTNLYNAVIGK